jgi:phage terminase large subunit GpA-like protein
LRDLQAASDADKSRKGKVYRDAYGVWNVGTEYNKQWIYGQLAADMERAEDERTFIFPGGLPSDYFDGLLSEVYDPAKRRFVQKPGARYKRNEPIDTLDYAWAIGHHKAILIGMRHTRDGFAPNPAWWKRKAEELERAVDTGQIAQTPVAAILPPLHHHRALPRGIARR